MSANLVIVESPTKARTLAKYLGKNFQIEASMGHLVDLPKSELGVDVENDFEPKYIIPRDKKKRANEIKKLAKTAQTIWLASDPDREGEAIAWHLAGLLRREEVGVKEKKQKKDNSLTHHTSTPNINRVVFHEITKGAIQEAFEHPRGIDLQLVDAQQARRVLDRLVGYKLSPLLWKKVKRGLSAGRVQTVALRLIVEREREIEKFVPVEYWSIDAELEAKGNRKFWASLIGLNGEKLEVHSQKEADTHVKNLESAEYKISKVNKKQVKRSAPPPFTTSTLQQNAGNKLGYTAKKTMMLAQNLYEHGLITYMRTDSVNLSSFALNMAREYILEKLGKNYLPENARVFHSKSKNAQEAHEAIRPTDVKVTSNEVGGIGGLTRDHARLYDLIWKRTLASQITDALLDQTSVDVEAQVKVNRGQATGDSKTETVTSNLLPVTYLLRATGSVLKFDGWLKLYGIKQLEEQEQDPEEQEGSKKQVLPELFEEENLDLLNLDPLQHFTEPPPRYTEASLIKKLEELGIGRPSTYAPILSTIQERFYVERQERKFVPTILGKTAADFLIKYFPEIFDYEFTALMEDQLDEISRGERKWRETIKTFYTPMEGKLEKTLEEAEHVSLPVETVDKNCPKCGKQLIIRTGRFGKFLACSGFPDCKHTEALEEKVNAKCPEDGGDIVVRKTKRGKVFYGCKNYPKCKYASWTKPK